MLDQQVAKDQSLQIALTLVLALLRACCCSRFAFLTLGPVGPALGPAIGGCVAGVRRRVDDGNTRTNSPSQWHPVIWPHSPVEPLSRQWCPSQKPDLGENGSQESQTALRVIRACLVFSRSRTSDCIRSSGRYGMRRGRGAGGG